MPAAPLRIALDYRPALLSRSGIGRATRELAAALAARDDLHVHLFGHSLAAVRVPHPAPARATLHRWRLPGRALPWLQRCGLGADRLAGRPAVFHWTDYVHPPLSHAAAVLTVHDLAFVRDPAWHGPDAAVLAARTRAAVAASRAIVVPSAATAADLRAFAPEARSVHVVPFGADHLAEPATRAPDPLDGRPFALCVGTLEPRKNHRALLAAFRAWRGDRPRLVVVGGIGWECAEVVADLRAAVAEGWAEWREHAGDATLQALLAHARFLVYPSLWEGFGFPPLEAMQRGVPVLAHDCAPLQELTDGAALLVDARDPVALAAALARLHGDAALRAQLAAAGRRRAAAFRWRDCAAGHARVYHEVAP